MKKFKACMFDFDGTLTKKGVRTPNQKIVKMLLKLAKKMPFAICTGREFTSFEKHFLGSLFAEIPKKNQAEFLKNIFLLGENGAIGHFYNEKKGRFEEFYKVAWPSQIIPKKKLMKILSEEVSKFGVVIDRHEIVLVIQAMVNGNNYLESNIEKIYEHSLKIYEICDKVLKSLVKNYEKYFHIGNSGIGVLIGPAIGDKDMAIKRFADFLQKKRGTKFGAKAREILCMGDKPLKDGNDFYFLNGRFGTPYTVGDFDQKKKFPLPVLDKEGKRLKNDRGTLFLINQNILKSL